MCIALLAVFIANRAVRPVGIQVSSCNLDANPPVLRPAAEVCSSLYTETLSTLLVTGRFSHWSLPTCLCAASSSLQTALAPPCRFVAAQKINRGFPKLHRIYRVILCHCCSSPTSAGIAPCYAACNWVLLSTGERKFHTLEGLCLDFHIFFLEVPQKALCGVIYWLFIYLFICHWLAYRQWSLQRLTAFC